jgi:PAS domain S-box-containing protein
MSFPNNVPSASDATDRTASASSVPASHGPTHGRQDITDRYEALVQLVQLAPDATVVVDASGRIRLVNRQTEELFGYSADALLGQPVELLVPDRLRALHHQFCAEYAHAPRVRPMGAHLTLSGRKRDGGEFPLEASLGPVTGEDGLLVIVSIRDVSERQQAHAAVETANQDLRALQLVTDTALSHLTLSDLLTALLERVTSVLQVDNAAVLLLDAAGATLTVRAVRGLQEPVAHQVQVPMGQGFAGRIAATREPLVVDDIATIPVANPFLRQQLHSVAGVPLLVADQLLGVVHIGTVQPRHFTAHDVQHLQQAADRMALAIDRARVYGREQHARELAEAALAQAHVSEHRYQRLVEANIIGIVVSDSEQILEANDAFLQVVGYTRADLKAGRLRRVLLTTPDSYVLARRAVQQARTTGASMPFECEYVRKDRRQVSTLVGTALLQHDPVRFVTFVLDLTKRKQLEWALAEQVAQLEAIMEAVPEPLCVYDGDGRVVLANSAYHTLIVRLFPGASPSETFSQHIQQAGGVYRMDGTPLEIAELAHSRVLRGEVLTGGDAVDIMVPTAEGGHAYLSTTGAPLRDSAGNITGAVAVSRDVTAYKRLEYERAAAHASELVAQEVAQQLDGFFAMAAHDIRTPVTVVSGYVDLALQRAERLARDLTAGAPTTAVAAGTAAIEHAGSKMVDSLRNAQTAVDQLQRLVNYLFDVARARSGGLQVALAPCDLAALVRRNVTAQQAAVPERRIDLDAPEAVVLVTADADRLDQVLSNYLSNALKYSPADQPVTVKLEIVEQQAVLSVVDHGPGLAPAEQHHIWELFHRAPGIEVQPGSSKVSDSLGLGLHICKQLVELHPGGSVGVESSVGHGSTFWFTLPLAGPAPGRSGAAL